MPDTLQGRFREHQWLHHAIDTLLKEDGPLSEQEIVRALDTGGMELGQTHKPETVLTCLNLYIRSGRYTRREGKVYLAR